MTSPRKRQPDHHPRWPTVLAVGLGLLLVVTVLSGPVVANHTDDPTSTFLVELDEDGSATVSLTVAYDLTTDEERAAFQSIQNDETTKEEFRQRFANRMQRAAAASAEQTGRDMSVSDPSIGLETSGDGETGYATVSVQWSNLAAREDGRLVVAEPFASGFTPQYQFVFVAPDGYRIDEVSNSPDFEDETHAVWSARMSLDGFQTSAVSSTEGGASATGGQPGFGMGLTWLAITVVFLFGIRRSVRRTGWGNRGDD